MGGFALAVSFDLSVWKDRAFIRRTPLSISGTHKWLKQMCSKMLRSKCKVPIIEYGTEREQGKTTSHVHESVEQSRSKVA